MPTPIAATGASPTPATTTVQRPDQLGRDTFLALLVAQLRYQNPMSPMEGTEFVAQSAQMTMVERLNELAEQSAVALAGQQSVAAASLIGRQVTWLDAQGGARTGLVTGARFTTDGPVLLVDRTVVALGQVVEVKQASAG